MHHISVAPRIILFITKSKTNNVAVNQYTTLLILTDVKMYENAISINAEILQTPENSANIKARSNSARRSIINYKRAITSYTPI